MNLLDMYVKFRSEGYPECEALDLAKGYVALEEDLTIRTATTEWLEQRMAGPWVDGPVAIPVHHATRVAKKERWQETLLLFFLVVVVSVALVTWGMSP